MALIVVAVLAPIGLSMVGFAILDIQGFMRSSWAFWVLMVCLFVPYSLAYTADIFRRREARTAVSSAGDASPLVFASSSSVPLSEPEIGRVESASRSHYGWIWVGFAAFVAYAAFRIAWALAGGAAFDWTAVIALVAIVCFASIMPSVVAWQRFRRAVLRIDKARATWPAFRTDQFATELHRSRPGATIPQDLILSASNSTVDVWTAEREPRLLVSFPRDAATTLNAFASVDRLGSSGVRIERHDGHSVEPYEFIARRKGVLTYFRTDEATAQRCAEELTSGRGSE
ncbi:hypothetical protein [Leifsonia sp. AG29]|uniref:hypothetical protein n=1 Tax=Leifsonia sp. AG29 TaxID=2598860 RepID=UPI00131AB91C|nr:hypothetical protein [Leifsonia sp. AG29]